MQASPSIADFRPRRIRPAGFTLVELMVVLVIIGALVAMSAPSYSRAVEQSRVNVAAANLRAIWSAERLYWLGYRQYGSATNLQTLLDPDIFDGSSTGGYTYSLVVTGGGSGFTATATHKELTASYLTIDENGEFDTSASAFKPSFQ